MIDRLLEDVIVSEGLGGVKLSLHHFLLNPF